MTEEDIRRVKEEKISALRDAGTNPYPERFERTHTLADATELAEGTDGVRLAGRVISRREFGKLAFFDLQDFRGRCQCSIQVDAVGKEGFKAFSRFVDIGDFVGVEGQMYRTKVGQLTLQVSEYQVLGKTLFPLPEKYHAIADQELRYRRRYLDLVMDEESRSRFRKRNALIRAMRDHLDANGFDEVETPVLGLQASGALANPFRTHHAALDIPLYLRIAPELYLKRLIVAGYDRVYEFARCFRNEGMDPSHLQEFTMLEFYAAYWNFVDNMNFTEDLIRTTLEKTMGTLRIESGDEVLDFSGDWPRRPLMEIIDEYAGIDLEKHRDADSLRAATRERKIVIEGAEKLGWGSLVDQLYKKTCRPQLVQPVFVTSHPIEISPLARQNDDRPTVADRFQLVARGWELINAYSELVDPAEQRHRLEEQARLRAQGDDEAMAMDEDYILAMEHGMPPISGWGMGVDRFAALVSGVENLRDVVLFPLMKKETGTPGAVAPDDAT